MVINNILINPGSGVLLSNKGTVAILITTIENIRKEFPDAHIAIELYWPEKQKKLYDIKKEFDTIEVIPHPIERPIYAVLALSIAFLLYPLNKISGPLYRNINIKLFPWLKHYLTTDVIINQSVEAFVIYYDENLSQRIVRYMGHLYTLFFARLFGKRYVLFAHTLAPFGWPFKSIMRGIIKNASFVTLRDDISYENLKREDAIYENIYITADPAFLLDVKEDMKENNKKIKNDIENINRLKTNGKRFVGVCLARTTGIKLDNDKYLNYVKIVADTVDSLIIDYNSIVIFISHSSGKVRKTQSDSLVGEDIKNRLENKDSFYILNEDYDPREIKCIISELDLIITHRMHPAIFSLSTGVPCILFGFNEKAYGLMDRFGLREYVVPINSISNDEILVRVDQILHDYDNVKQTISERLPYIVNLSRKNFGLLKNLL